MIYNRISNAIVINLENGTLDYNGVCTNIPSTINARAQYSYYTGHYNLEYFSRTGGRYLVYIKQDYTGAVQNLDVTVAAGGKIFSFGSAEGDANNEILIREVQFDCTGGIEWIVGKATECSLGGNSNIGGSANGYFPCQGLSTVVVRYSYNNPGLDMAYGNGSISFYDENNTQTGSTTSIPVSYGGITTNYTLTVPSDAVCLKIGLVLHIGYQSGSINSSATITSIA